MHNKIKITCKKHNCLFEVLATKHFSSAKKEIKENILLSGGCNECISCIRKANIYKNNDTHLPENYNENDWKNRKLSIFGILFISIITGLGRLSGNYVGNLSTYYESGCHTPLQVIIGYLIILLLLRLKYDESTTINLLYFIYG